MKNKKLFTFHFFFGIAIHLLACAPPKNSLVAVAYDYEIQQAKRLIDLNRNVEAMDDLNMLIQLDSRNKDALFLRGLAYQKLNQFEAAVADYKKVVEIVPSMEKAHYNLAMIYTYKLNQPSYALKHFDEFLTTSPNSEAAFEVAKIMSYLDSAESKGDLFLQAQIFVQAAQIKTSLKDREEILNEGVKKLPESPILYFVLAELYAIKANKNQNLYEKALHHYRVALEKRPTCAPCHLGLGKLLIARKQHGKASIHLRKAQLFDPHSKIN